MNEHYPRIRHHEPGPEGDYLLIREVVRLVLYLPFDHQDLAAGVNRAMDTYLQGVGGGPDTLSRWCDGESGDVYSLDAQNWERIRLMLRMSRKYRYLDQCDNEEYVDHQVKKQCEISIGLSGGTSGTSGYGLFYWARLPWSTPEEDELSVMSFTWPTEYLEEKGPGRMREMAMELAAMLPFCSGHAGLAFDLQNPFSTTMLRIREEAFRYPGVDVPRGGSSLGTRVNGVHWLNFLAQPVLGQVGGAAGLRLRLHFPETTVQQMDGERAVVTLGKWPEAGDLTQGRDLPAYRELARVLEPWFNGCTNYRWSGYTHEETRRWWRRFLD